MHFKIKSPATYSWGFYFCVDMFTQKSLLVSLGLAFFYTLR